MNFHSQQDDTNNYFIRLGKLTLSRRALSQQTNLGKLHFRGYVHVEARF